MEFVLVFIVLFDAGHSKVNVLELYSKKQHVILGVIIHLWWQNYKNP